MTQQIDTAPLLLPLADPDFAKGYRTGRDAYITSLSVPLPDDDAINQEAGLRNMQARHFRVLLGKWGEREGDLFAKDMQAILLSSAMASR